MKVTIREIAELCNVSRGTVDRVLHNRPNVHPQIRQTVQAAVERLGYEPPSTKQQPAALRRVGMLQPGWPDKYFLAHSQRGLRDALDKTDPTRFAVVTEAMGGRSVEEHVETVARLLSQDVDGLLLNIPMQRPVTDLVNQAVARGVRVMTYFDEAPWCPDTYFVGQDAVRSGRIAAGLMAKYLRPGEKVLTVSGNPDFYSHKTRAECFATHLASLAGKQALSDTEWCYEFEDLTAETVRRRLCADASIRYIYLATQSLTGCIRGLRAACRPYKVSVICNDTTAAAHRFLQSGDVDFVIGQSVSRTVSQAIDTLYRILCFGVEPRERKLYTGLTIYTQQMIQNEGVER